MVKALKQDASVREEVKVEVTPGAFMHHWYEVQKVVPYMGHIDGTGKSV